MLMGDIANHDVHATSRATVKAPARNSLYKLRNISDSHTRDRVENGRAFRLEAGVEALWDRAGWGLRVDIITEHVLHPCIVEVHAPYSNSRQRI
jgi:hypothetical protein